VRDLVSTVLLVAGVAVLVLSVLGVTLMRDAYDRLHYVGLAGFGALLVGVAILVQESWSLIGDKALAAGALLVLAGPVLVHTTARSLRVHEYGSWESGIRGYRDRGPAPDRNGGRHAPGARTHGAGPDHPPSDDEPRRPAR